MERSGVNNIENSTILTHWEKKKCLKGDYRETNVFPELDMNWCQKDQNQLGKRGTCWECSLSMWSPNLEHLLTSFSTYNICIPLSGQ